MTAAEFQRCVYKLELATWPDFTSTEDGAKRLAHLVGVVNHAAHKWHRAAGNWHRSPRGELPLMNRNEAATWIILSLANRGGAAAATRIFGRRADSLRRWIALRYASRKPARRYKIFRAMDADDSGQMHFEELREVLRGAYPGLSLQDKQLSPAHLRGLWRALDADA